MRFKLTEKSFESVELLTPAFPDRLALIFCELCIRYIKPNMRIICYCLKVIKIGAELWTCPTAYRSLFDRFLLIRHDKIHIDTDRASKPFAFGTCTERTIERKQLRVRLFIGDTVIRALEAVTILMFFGCSVFAKTSDNNFSA